MPIQSPHAPLSLPETDIFSFMFRRYNRPFQTTQVIYQDGDNLRRCRTFDDVEKAAVAFGIGLQEKFKIGKGDTIAVIAPNDVDTPTVHFGILSIGAVVTAINPGYTRAEIAHHLQSSETKVILTHPSVLDTVLQSAEDSAIPVSHILLYGQRSADEDLAQIPYWTSIKKRGATFQPPRISPKDDLAYLVFSSGTTGLPKAVMLTHFGLTTNILQLLVGEFGHLNIVKGFGRIPGIRDAPLQGDRLLSCLPFFHALGLITHVLLPVYLGVPSIIMARFDIEKWCQIVQGQKITYCYVAPPIVLQLAKHPVVSQYDLSSIRMLTSGGAPLKQDLPKAVYKRTGIPIKQAYGLTETGPANFIQSWKGWEEGLGTCGMLFPNTEMKICCIADNSEQISNSEPPEVRPGEPGELFFRSGSISKGYWKNPAATADAMSKDGWFRTGDIGYLDSQGRLRITDRLKELIKFKGFQVAPAELEGLLIDHELVEDAAVVGVQSEEFGTEIPLACIVRKGGVQSVKPGDDKAILHWFASKVSHVKKLRGGVIWMASVPKTPSGKILRRLLRDNAQIEFSLRERRRLKGKL